MCHNFSDAASSLVDDPEAEAVASVAHTVSIETPIYGGKVHNAGGGPDQTCFNQMSGEK